MTVDAYETDGRVRLARLTNAGRAERAELDRRSDELATSILRPLNDSQRQRLVAAMEEVESFNAESYAHHWFEKTLDPARPPGG